jgi:ATP-dependent DNA helicase RecG
VDVSNATVILVEHAERFGLAQLHQLRGRVGRSAIQSYCLLLASGRGAVGNREEWSRQPAVRSGTPGRTGSSPSRQRLEALVNSTDGFVIAEEDLRIRGPGEFFGVRQWGLPELRVANLIRDGVLLGPASVRAASPSVAGRDAAALAGQAGARVRQLTRVGRGLWGCCNESNRI